MVTLLSVSIIAVVTTSAILITNLEEPKPVSNTGTVAPRSEVEVLTDELNALNLLRAPLIESCGRLKATESEIRLRTDRLSEIRNK